MRSHIALKVVDDDRRPDKERAATKAHVWFYPSTRPRQISLYIQIDSHCTTIAREQHLESPPASRGKSTQKRLALR